MRLIAFVGKLSMPEYPGGHESLMKMTESLKTRRQNLGQVNTRERGDEVFDMELNELEISELGVGLENFGNYVEYEHIDRLSFELVVALLRYTTVFNKMNDQKQKQKQKIELAETSRKLLSVEKPTVRSRLKNKLTSPSGPPNTAVSDAVIAKFQPPIKNKVERKAVRTKVSPGEMAQVVIDNIHNVPDFTRNIPKQLINSKWNRVGEAVGIVEALSRQGQPKARDVVTRTTPSSEYRVDLKKELDAERAKLRDVHFHGPEELREYQENKLMKMFHPTEYARKIKKELQQEKKWRDSLGAEALVMEGIEPNPGPKTKQQKRRKQLKKAIKQQHKQKTGKTAFTSISQPKAIYQRTSNVQYSKPRITFSQLGMRVSHKEYLGDVVVSNAAGYTPLYAVQVNPGNVAAFPWLSSMSPNFESFKIHKLAYRVQPVAPTSVGGELVMSFDYDAADGAPMSKSQQLQAFAWKTCSLYGATGGSQQRCEYSHKAGGNLKQWYVLTPNSAGTPVQLYTPAVFYIAASNVSGASANTLVSDLYVEYDIELLVPQSTANSTTAGFFQALSQYTGVYGSAVSTLISNRTSNVNPLVNSTMQNTGANAIFYQPGNTGISVNSATGEVKLPLSNTYYLVMCGARTNGGHYLTWNNAPLGLVHCAISTDVYGNNAWISIDSVAGDNNVLRFILLTDGTASTVAPSRFYLQYQPSAATTDPDYINIVIVVLGPNRSLTDPLKAWKERLSQSESTVVVEGETFTTKQLQSKNNNNEDEKISPIEKYIMIRQS